ncbi:MAG: hypothetical protein PHE43_04675 [Candidatus Nanoarchaeia archaeon]|nr:hypothetical protein [Candidatus Nanoarchaeia archaeon]
MAIKEKDQTKVIQGKKNRASGAAFELKVRKDLESKGWNVSKWQNNVEFVIEEPGVKNQYKEKWEFRTGKLIPAKRKYNPFNKAFSIGTGFPDFICYSHFNSQIKDVTCKEYKDELEKYSKELKLYNHDYGYEVIGVEVKSNGYLDKEERKKCKWLIENNKFSKILIAKKSKEKGGIIYTEFKCD